MYKRVYCTEKQKRTDLVVTLPCTTRSWPQKSKKFNKKKEIIFLCNFVDTCITFFFSKVSHLLCLVKNPHAEFYIFEGNQSMDAEPPVIARQREDQFILVNAPFCRRLAVISPST